MLRVQQIKSELFTSHVYLITSSNSEEVFLIDCGTFENVFPYLTPTSNLAGIFLTHYHYDHIYFIEKWVAKFPNVKIYGSSITKDGLSDPKRNLSFYHEDPIIYHPLNFNILKEHDTVPLFEKDFELRVIETEGHCEGSLSFILENYIFSGDALIPNIPVVTKLKTGSKEESKKSIVKIKRNTTADTIVCPGHLEMIKSNEVNWELYIDA